MKNRFTNGRKGVTVTYREYEVGDLFLCEIEDKATKETITAKCDNADLAKQLCSFKLLHKTDGKINSKYTKAATECRKEVFYFYECQPLEKLWERRHVQRITALIRNEVEKYADLSNILDLENCAIIIIGTLREKY